MYTGNNGIFEVYTRFTSNSICYYPPADVYKLHNRRIHRQQRNMFLPTSWRARRALAAILAASSAAAFAARFLAIRADLKFSNSVDLLPVFKSQEPRGSGVDEALVVWSLGGE